MSKESTEENELIPSGRVTATAAYSARIQEAMRYNRLRSPDYPIVMSIMRAVSQGLTEEKWKIEQQSYGQRAKERVLTYFAPQRELDEYMQVYQDCMAAHRLYVL